MKVEPTVYGPEYYTVDANGNKRFKTTQERLADMRRADQANRQIKEQVAAAAAPKLTDAEKVRAAMADRIDTLKRDMQFGTPADRAKAREALKMYTAKLAEHDKAAAESARVERFNKHELAQSARAYADGVEKTAQLLYGDVPAHELAMLVSLGKSTEFATPEAMYQAFAAQRDKVESLQLEHDKKRAMLANEAALKAEAEAAHAQVRAIETEKRLATGAAQ
jgi:hypothetical protein